jgi:spoIIIJ-associated protein
MSAAKRRFFSGNTIEQALVAAASHFRVAPERIAYRPVEKRHGFVRIQRRVVIEVDPEHPVREEPAPGPTGEPAPPAGLPRAPSPRPAAPQIAPPRPGAPRPVAEGPLAVAPERSPAAGRSPARPAREPSARPEADAASDRPPTLGPEDLLPAAREALGGILRLAALDLAGEFRLAGGWLEVELSGTDRDRLLDEDGELLRAIEYLLPRVMRGAAGESLGCRVDSGGFRQRRESELQELARRTAEEVRTSGRPVTLEPLNPAERRLVHLALAEDPQVETASEGDGYFKRITIRRIP